MVHEEIRMRMEGGKEGQEVYEGKLKLDKKRGKIKEENQRGKSKRRKR